MTIKGLVLQSDTSRVMQNCNLSIASILLRLCLRLPLYMYSRPAEYKSGKYKDIILLTPNGDQEVYTIFPRINIFCCISVSGKVRLNLF